MTSLDDRAAFRDLLTILPVSDIAKDDLARRMRAPDRFYHSDKHVGGMWSLHLALAAEAGLEHAEAQRRLACAVAFHDSVLRSGRTDNERRSAELWLDVSRDSHVSVEDRRAVAVMIEATADHIGIVPRLDMSEHDRELCWLLDLDLAPLGDTPEVFAGNTEDLRREAAGLGEHEWRKGTIEFLSTLMAVDPLYRCRPIASRREKAAQANMTRALKWLSAREADAA